MTTASSQRPRRVWRVPVFAAGWLIIVLAVLMALVQLLLPLLARQPAWVAQKLSERLHRPVSIQAMSGHWALTGPRFELRGVRVGAAAGSAPIALPRVDVGLDLGSWAWPTRRLINLHVSGLHLEASRASDGQWQIKGFGGGSSGGQPPSLQHLSVALWLDDLQVTLSDDVSGRTYPLVADQLRVSIGSGRMRFGARMRRQQTAAVFTVAGNFSDNGASGRVWLGGQQLHLGPLLGDVAIDDYRAVQGRGQLAAWLTWKQRRVTRSVVQMQLADLAIAGPDGQQARVASLSGIGDLIADANGYRLRWAGADNSALLLAVRQPGTAQTSVGLAASNLQIAPLLPWLALKPDLAPTLARWVGQGRPRGVLTRAALQWRRSAGIDAVAVDFRDLGIDATAELPGVEGLGGQLLGDAQSLSLTLPAQKSLLRLPTLYAQPLHLDSLAGTLAFWHDQDAWQIGIDPLDFATGGVTGQVRGTLSLPDGGGSPQAALYASIDPGELSAAKALLPTRAMSAATTSWLQQALVSGHIDHGAVLLHGHLADWPFRKHEGRFEADLALSQLTLNYGKDWPRAEQLAVTASFSGTGLQVQARGGRAGAVQVEHAAAQITDYADPVLKLQASGHGSGQSLLDFVRTSPIAKAENGTLSKLSLGGRGQFDLNLALPLGNLAALTVNGTAALQNVDLVAEDFQLRLGQITGPLAFDAKGLRGGPLQTVFHGQPAALTLAIAGATGDPNTVLHAHLDGRYSLAELVQDQPAIHWLGEAAEGRAPFAVDFTLARAGSDAPLTQTLGVDSSLQGIALKLPAPLDKPADTALPLNVTLGLPVSGSDLRFSLGHVLRGRFRLASNTAPLAGALMLGGTVPGVLPTAGLRIRGQTGRVDLSGWVQRTVAASAGGEGPSLESLDLRADHALLFGNDFPAMRLQVTPGPNALVIDASSATLDGHFDVPNDLTKAGITARMKRLYWPRADEKPAVAKAAAVTAEPVEDPHPEDVGVAPASLPPLHLMVDDLRLGRARLGRARLETWPTPQGMHIDQMRALSPSAQITASGDWTGSAQNSHTQMRIDFAAQSLGAMLTALGYSGLVESGKTRAHLDGIWPGAPSSIDLATTRGKLSVDVIDGRIPEVAPGVGRLFGLVSLAELPRRLGLDFGDVVGKGLAFDSIKGNFALGGGDATTSDLMIRGPAAQISITGRTGLRAKDYDQQVRVTPHVGNSLPVVGAVVAGPLGAAAGFAMQGLLGRGINQAASARYTITGSWKKPVMTLIEKKGQPAVPAPAASSAR